MNLIDKEFADACSAAIAQLEIGRPFSANRVFAAFLKNNKDKDADVVSRAMLTPRGQEVIDEVNRRASDRANEILGEARKILTSGDFNAIRPMIARVIEADPATFSAIGQPWADLIITEAYELFCTEQDARLARLLRAIDREASLTDVCQRMACRQQQILNGATTRQRYTTFFDTVRASHKLARGGKYLEARTKFGDALKLGYAEFLPDAPEQWTILLRSLAEKPEGRSHAREELHVARLICTTEDPEWALIEQELDNPRPRTVCTY